MMFLPKQLGGLSLGFEDELEFHFTNSPYPIQAILTKMARGECVREEGRILRKITCNPAVRGIPYLQERTMLLQQCIEDDGDYKSLMHIDAPVKKLSYWDMKDRVEREFPESKFDNNWAVRQAEELGIYTHHRFIEHFLRGSIFLELLTKEPSKRKIFNTIPYIDRYMKVRKRLIELCSETDVYDIPSNFNEVFDKYLLDKIIYIDVNQTVGIPISNTHGPDDPVMGSLDPMMSGNFMDYGMNLFYSSNMAGTSSNRDPDSVGWSYEGNCMCEFRTLDEVSGFGAPSLKVPRYK
jgi:hypothetical protein